MLRAHSHLATMTQTFNVFSIISYVVRNGLQGYQCNCSHMTKEKHIVIVKCERTLTAINITPNYTIFEIEIIDSKPISILQFDFDLPLAVEALFLLGNPTLRNTRVLVHYVSIVCRRRKVKISLLRLSGDLRVIEYQDIFLFSTIVFPLFL